MQVIKVKLIRDIPKNYTGIIEWPEGDIWWYLNGSFHREDGPAIECANGEKWWYLNGKYHREDGPAIEYPDGRKWWYLNGKYYSEAEWKFVVEKLNKEREEANKPKLQEIEVEYLNQVPKGFTGIVKHKNGNKYWFLKGECHREDGPAVELADGEKHWYLNGKYHRVDGPAIERADGHKEWYLNDKLHREDGPAIEKVNGTKRWHLNDMYHRVDGPAVEYSDGSREWWLNGERHREDGPAVEYPDGSKEWWLNGSDYTEADWKVAVERLKKEREEANKPKLQEIEVECLNQVPKGFTGLVKHKNGNKFWYLNGYLHREDGPAKEYADGTKEWWLNGVFHREDGPAVEEPDGTKCWYLNGLIHREDGPAREYPDGEKHWYLNGKRHREDGPAVEYPDGRKEWYLNGKRHREDGPAFEAANGSKEWWLNGKYYSEAEWLAAKSVPQKTGEPALTETVASRTMEPSQPVVNKTTETNDKPANGEKNKMSTMENIKEIAVSDAKVVAYRVAASQIGKVMTNAVIKLLSGNMKGKQLAGFRKNMTEFFQTPLGEALLMFMIGCATPFFIKYVPEKYRAHALKVAEAARHEAEFIAASKLMDSFMPILSMAGSGMFSALEGLVSSSEEEESSDRIRIDAGNSSVSQLQEENVVSHASARRAVG